MVVRQDPQGLVYGLRPSLRSADVGAVNDCPVRGFVYVMRDEQCREFLAVQTFGDSRGKAKRAALAMNRRRMDARKPALEMLRVCEVGLRVLGTPAETYATRDRKDVEIERLRDALRHLVHNVKATGKRLDLGLALTAAEAALGPNVRDEPPP